jgi:ABC-type bacteriocin/lantibiotic exporter with double-glycine peptidase domain
MVAQKDGFGCGVACVASLLRFSYSQALNLFDIPEQAQSVGFHRRDIAQALQNAGISASYKYVSAKTRKKIYRNDTIVFIARNKSYPAGHYLLRIQKGWIDPWINFPITKDIKNAKAGIRKRLPGRPIYAVFPVQ